MSTILDREYYSLREYAQTEYSRELLEEIYKLLKKENETNILARLPIYNYERDIWDIDWEEINYDELNIISGWYVTTSGDYLTEEDRDNRIEELRDKIDYLGEDSEEILQLESLIEEIENAEWEPDEVYWNVVWRYNNREPDLDIAMSIGLGVLEYKDEGWIFLTGCGMDLSPKLAAYGILKYRGVSEEDTRHFRNKNSIDYFKHIVGEIIFNKVVDILNIKDLI
ncbi:hypothetical protein H6G33_10375 [Calothrix sp. FACHB-1219]|uniref:hypothetical protein n=1 Tax=unclassified Calothrix TaxID=2619626 RepID=UPI0016853832|nr:MULTISPECIES: hypothetical protein [unclassified Calothrix]MBD2201752.1 hypothetical protein [Calothrix sp. FACHB-168]MBD2217438.1 hypothetical protein [Calothrix sp. FACHB-1219]